MIAPPILINLHSCVDVLVGLHVSVHQPSVYYFPLSGSYTEGGGGRAAKRTELNELSVSELDWYFPFIQQRLFPLWLMTEKNGYLRLHFEK